MTPLRHGRDEKKNGASDDDRAEADGQADYNNAADQPTDSELELENILCSPTNTMEKIELAPRPLAPLFSVSHVVMSEISTSKMRPVYRFHFSNKGILLCFTLKL